MKTAERCLLLLVLAGCPSHVSLGLGAVPDQPAKPSKPSSPAEATTPGQPVKPTISDQSELKCQCSCEQASYPGKNLYLSGTFNIDSASGTKQTQPSTTSSNITDTAANTTSTAHYVSTTTGSFVKVDTTDTYNVTVTPFPTVEQTFPTDGHPSTGVTGKSNNQQTGRRSMNRRGRVFPKRPRRVRPQPRRKLKQRQITPAKGKGKRGPPKRGRAAGGPRSRGPPGNRRRQAARNNPRNSVAPFPMKGGKNNNNKNNKNKNSNKNNTNNQAVIERDRAIIDLIKSLTNRNNNNNNARNRNWNGGKTTGGWNQRTTTYNVPTTTAGYNVGNQAGSPYSSFGMSQPFSMGHPAMMGMNPNWEGGFK